MIYRLLGKRLFDLLASFSAMGMTFPVLVPAVTIAALQRRGSPFFFQHRPGKDGRIFKIIKLRTMNDEVDDQGKLLPPSERITRLGRLMRATSLDELPQLINVIVGDMSIVGPRPLRVEYLEHYSKEQTRRHEVKPGITGWAQVNGRNALNWEEKFEHDVWYVDNLCFCLDMKILFLTVWKALQREGINAESGATMKQFKGAKLNG